LLSAFRPLPESQGMSGETQPPKAGNTMIANAVLLTIGVLLAYGFWLLDQLKFMAPYRTALFHSYGSVILLATAVLFANVFGAALLLQRKFLLKDTGRKLTHLDRQFQIGQVEMPAPDDDGEAPRHVA